MEKNEAQEARLATVDAQHGVTRQEMRGVDLLIWTNDDDEPAAIIFRDGTVRWRS